MQKLARTGCGLVLLVALFACQHAQQKNPSRSRDHTLDAPPPPSRRPGPPRPQPRLTLDVKPYSSGHPRLIEAEALWAKGKLDEAVTQFRSALQTTSEQPLRAMVELRLARLYEAKKEWEKAGELYLASAGRYRLLRDYLTYRAARAFLAAKDKPKAERLFARVERGSIWRASARYWYASLLAEREQKIKALGALEGLVTSGGNDVRLLYAGLQEALGDWAMAIAAYKELLVEAPGTHWSREAEARLKAIRKKVPASLHTRLFDLTVPQRLRQAERLFTRHASNRVVELLTPAIESWSVGSYERCLAQYYVGRSYRKLRKRSKGLPFYSAFVKECKGPQMVRIRVLYNAGKDSADVGDEAAMLRYFELLRKEFPKHSYNDDAYFRVAKYYLDKTRYADVVRVLRRQLAEYPTGDMREHAWWVLVWQAYRQKRWQEALQTIEASLRAVPRETTYYSQGRMMYWRARVRVRLGDRKAALADYWRCIEQYPMSYYGLLAANRLREAKVADFEERLRRIAARHSDVSRLPALSLEGLGLHLGFRRALALLRLGLTAEAQRELAALGLLSSSSPARLWLVAKIFSLAGAYHVAVGTMRRRFVAWQEYFPHGDVLQYWTTAYPRGFRSLVSRASTESGPPQELIWSIMREESGFNPRVESWANAMGLMQLLLGTAKGAARGLSGVGAVTRERLLEPRVNIRLGSRFLGRLLKGFGDHPALAIAGYNAGGGSVRRWLREFGQLPLDEFVESIPYRQTRDYTKRVLASYGIYWWLQHGSGSLPVLSFALRR